MPLPKVFMLLFFYRRSEYFRSANITSSFHRPIYGSNHFFFIVTFHSLYVFI